MTIIISPAKKLIPTNNSFGLETTDSEISNYDVIYKINRAKKKGMIFAKIADFVNKILQNF